MPPLEAKYFRRLSEWEESRDFQKREDLMSQMSEILQEGSVTSLAGDLLDLVQNPLAWTLFFMMELKNQKADAWWFKNRLIQKYSIPQIRQALAVLERQELISENQGQYQAKLKKIESPDQFEKVQNFIFHRHMIDESHQALEHIPQAKRNFGSLTVAIPKDKIEKFKKEINNFGKDLLHRYGGVPKVEGELFRVNVQLYPLTKLETNRENN